MTGDAMLTTRRTATVLWTGFLLFVPLVVQDERPRNDAQEIRALSDSYTTAWLRGAPEDVMAVFADDAALVPHLGAPHAKGTEAIHRHFWPPGTPPMTVTRFVQDSLEVVVDGTMGYDRGVFGLVFELEAGNAVTVEGNYLAVARKRDDTWKWIAYSWNHP